MASPGGCESGRDSPARARYFERFQAAALMSPAIHEFIALVTPMDRHPYDQCPVKTQSKVLTKERRVRWVVLLTAVMMVGEIFTGYTTGSMALIADGWHMATHVGALGLASVAYLLARRYSTHHAFSFGTGKIHALAGYTSAIGLGLVSLSMVFEGIARLLKPHVVDYASALPVAVLGLLVNVASVLLLDTKSDEPEHEDDHEHQHGHGHAHGHGHQHGHASDHNHRAALAHVLADALTSVLAIFALLAGRFYQIAWLDAASGIVGGAVILYWGFGLCRTAGSELLDVVPSAHLESDVRRALEALGDDTRVQDLHVWSLGRGVHACIVTLSAKQHRSVSFYKNALSDFELGHLTVEVQSQAPPALEREASPGTQ